MKKSKATKDLIAATMTPAGALRPNAANDAAVFATLRLLVARIDKASGSPLFSAEEVEEMERLISHAEGR